MDMLTLTVLAENRQVVQYTYRVWGAGEATMYRSHASCLAAKVERLSEMGMQMLLENCTHIACTTGTCRWCALPLVSRPHHSLQRPKAARLSKVVGAHNMDLYKRAAPLVFDFETFKPGVIGMDFAAIEARIHGQWEDLLAHGYKFNPDIFRK